MRRAWSGARSWRFLAAPIVAVLAFAPAFGLHRSTTTSWRGLPGSYGICFSWFQALSV